MLGGFALAYLYYIAASRRCRRRPPAAFRPIYLFLLNKWYFDELYDWLFVRPAFWIGRLLWKGGDGKIIDGLGPDGIANRVLWTTGRIVKLQTGYVYHYAFAMLIGVALIITAFMFAGSVAMTSTGFGLLSPHHLLPAGRRARSSPRSNKEAKGNARWIALYTTLFTLGAVALPVGPVRSGRIRASSSSRRWTGSAAPSATRWASTASRCCSSSSPPS